MARALAALGPVLALGLALAGARGAGPEAAHDEPAGLPELPELALDDECLASPDGACGLEALQLRGVRVDSAKETVAEGDDEHGEDDGAPAVPYFYAKRPLVGQEGEQLAARSGQSLESCEDLCDGTKGCQSMTVGQGAEQGKCFAKSQRVTAAEQSSTNGWSAERFVTYYRVDATGSGKFIGRSLVSDEGKQLSASSVKSVSECEQSCERTPGCQSFTLGVGSQWGKCYLKDKRVTANEGHSTNKYNLARFMTFYKAGFAPGPPSFSSDYERAKTCTSAAIITSPQTCQQAAQALGISPSRPRIVPPEDGMLPPGCLVGPGSRNMAAGMWYNAAGMQTGFFNPGSDQPVQAEEGFELLCKKKLFKLAAAGAQCPGGADVTDEAMCRSAANWLKLQEPQGVAADKMWTSPKGCFVEPGIWGAPGTLKFNGAPMSFGGAAQGVQFVCKA